MVFLESASLIQLVGLTAYASSHVTATSAHHSGGASFTHRRVLQLHFHQARLVPTAPSPASKRTDGRSRGAVVLRSIEATVCTMSSLRSSPSAQVMFNSNTFFTHDIAHDARRVAPCPRRCLLRSGGMERSWRDKRTRGESQHASPI